MTEETLAAFLARRERELSNKLLAIDSSRRDIEIELAQVRIAKERAEALCPEGAGFGVKIGDKRIVDDPEGVEGFQKTVVSVTNKMIGPDAAELSIDSLIHRTLATRLNSGSTAAEIRDFIRDAYDRDIKADSLRAQLHRLKSRHFVEKRENKWFLTNIGAMKFMYENPENKKTLGADIDRG